MNEQSAVDVPLVSERDVYLFREGTHTRLYQTLGAHLLGDAGAQFAVWAPNASRVTVIGDFNGWNVDADPLEGSDSGIWQGRIGHARHGQAYKYHIVSRHGDYRIDKSDPFAWRAETPPATASVLWELDYQWRDGDWMAGRARHSTAHAPISIYEMHLGSWRRVPEDGHRSLTYRELAALLPGYLEEMGYTHVELMPVMEHPFFGSWGYQITGYFAPSARQGTPQDFMFLIDALHRHGIGVILDWVPSHFPGDAHGLAYFDGSHLFEHADRRQGFHPEWRSYIFNYGRHEVRSFLISNALFWLDRYHADGLRVDAVASMLYLDYGRESGGWIPNRYGGRENLEAIDLLRQLNQAVHAFDPHVPIIAEESTAWPGVSRPVTDGGLGFGMKWNLGWMHDTLDYFSHDPVHRRYHHDTLTFSLIYAFHESFVLPLSHDEVVYGKGSLLTRMPGDDWQRFANLRALLGYMWGHPGKKLTFMGAELGQWAEWNHDVSLDWHLLAEPRHEGVRRWLTDLNRVYREHPALHELDFDPAGFEWVIADDRDQSVLAFLRFARDPADVRLVIANLTPVPRHHYRVGVPVGGGWRELLNSDAEVYGGSGVGNYGGRRTSPLPLHRQYHSLTLTLPPLGVLYLGPDRS